MKMISEKDVSLSNVECYV